MCGTFSKDNFTLYDLSELDHIAATCSKKDPRCPRGCPRAHANGVRECPRVRPEDWHCVNCNARGHSSAYAGCPARKRLQQAHELRAKKYMPLGVAIKACAPKPTFRRRSSTPEDPDRASRALHRDPPTTLTWAQRAAGLSPSSLPPLKSRDVNNAGSGPSGIGHTKDTASGSKSTATKYSVKSSVTPTAASLGGAMQSDAKHPAGSESGILRPGGQHSSSTMRSWKLGAGGLSQTQQNSSNQVINNLMTFMNERLEKLEQQISKNNEQITSEVRNIECKLQDIEHSRTKKLQTATEIINKNLTKKHDVVTKMAVEIISSLIDTAQNGNTQSLMRVLYDFAPRESVASLPTLPRMPEEIQSALFNVMGYSVEKENV